MVEQRVYNDSTSLEKTGNVPPEQVQSCNSLVNPPGLAGRNESQWKPPGGGNQRAVCPSRWGLPLAGGPLGEYPSRFAGPGDLKRGVRAKCEFFSQTTETDAYVWLPSVYTVTRPARRPVDPAACIPESESLAGRPVGVSKTCAIKIDDRGRPHPGPRAASSGSLRPCPTGPAPSLGHRLKFDQARPGRSNFDRGQNAPHRP